ncbi:hypothetical protein LR48_Vigan04g073000 [Vigna angularis]|uniref:DUF4110 domain-containing protein n=1 Tax=Phaseolus angularis TaxID=3914 RepID=A0A0L9UDB9_PHAAN|nr:hypothetical protein LR48_Vigan04g073000 [Vigna angularis]
MGKKTKKPGKGKEKTERKTVKAEEKKARRETKKLSPEDDIDAILLSIQKEEAKKKEVHVDDNVPAPSPRSNCSLTVNPLKETELILYGGEFYNGNKTFVYGDLFRYDVEKLEWKLVSSPNSPPPRSAHQAVAWKNYDFWMLDLKTNQWEQLNLKGCPSPRSGHRMWQEIKPKPGAMWPTARSGFQLFVYQDDIFLYGGYSKEVSSDKNNSEKGIVHSDMWSLDPKTWEWNKVKKSGMPPGPRAGFSMCVHKRRALLFGGVVDIEVEGDVMMSLFLNEFYGFQLDTNRWYPLELRKEKSTKDKLKKSEQNCPDDVNKKINPACTTREETVESEDEESNIDDISKNIASNMSIVDSENLTNSDGKPKESGAKLDIQSSLPEVVKPCGRINACMAVGRDTLYIYGGMMEIKDQEITLDDLYSLNLSKLDEWKCIIPAQNASVEVGDAVALIKGVGKNLRRKERRSRIEQIRASLGLSDSQRTPMPGESLRDFYRRTNMYWQMAAHEHTQHTGKELRKDGFDLAEARYRELKPILDELALLEAEQKAEEAEGPEASVKKRGKKKTRN